MQAASTPSSTSDANRHRPGRAAPLAPPERRAAIIAATIPLLRHHGLAVSTRRIAEAAGVAEGTIFSVFPDKDTLIATAVDAALDPGPVIDQIGAIDRSLTLEQQLEDVVRALQVHVAETWQLLVAVGPDGTPRRSAGATNAIATRHVIAIEPLFRPAVAELSQTPGDAARALLALTLGCSHPTIVDEPLPAHRIVELLLDGVRRSSR